MKADQIHHTDSAIPWGCARCRSPERKYKEGVVMGVGNQPGCIAALPVLLYLHASWGCGYYCGYIADMYLLQKAEIWEEGRKLAYSV